MNSWVIPRTVTVPIGSWRQTVTSPSYSFIDGTSIAIVPSSSSSTSGYNEPESASAVLSSSFVTTGASAAITVTTATVASSTALGGMFGGTTLAPRVITTTAGSSGTSTYPTTTVVTTTSSVTSTTSGSSATTSVVGHGTTALTWSRGQSTVYDTYINSASGFYGPGAFFVGSSASSPVPVGTTAAGSTSASYSQAGSANVVSYTVPYVTASANVSTISVTNFAVTTYQSAQIDVLYYTEPDQLSSFPNSTMDGLRAGEDITTGWSVSSTISSWVETSEVGYHVSSTSSVPVVTTSLSTAVLPIWGGFQTFDRPYVLTSSTRSVIAAAPVNTGDTNGTVAETRLLTTAPPTSSFYAISSGPTPSAGFLYPQDRMALFTDSGTSAGVTLSATPSVGGISLSQFGQAGRYAPVIEPPATGLTTGTGTPVTFATGGATTTLWKVPSFGPFSTFSSTQLAAGQSWQAGLPAGIYRTALGSSTGTSIYSGQILSSTGPLASVTQFRTAPQAMPSPIIGAHPLQELGPMPIQPPLTPAVATWSVTPGY